MKSMIILLKSYSPDAQCLATCSAPQVTCFVTLNGVLHRYTGHVNKGAELLTSGLVDLVALLIMTTGRARSATRCIPVTDSSGGHGQGYPLINDVITFRSVSILMRDCAHRDG